MGHTGDAGSKNRSQGHIKTHSRSNRSIQANFRPFMKGEYTVRIKTPTFVSIREAAITCGLPYKTILGLCHAEKIIYFKSGKRYLINLDKLIEFLNTGEAESIKSKV